tara:strand:+ start:3056 stop:3289 length:234 start_codon:yes stop_codon:yes gene_type:complete
VVSSYDDEIRRVLKTGFNRMVENELLVHFQSAQIMRNLTGCRQHEPVVQKLKNLLRGLIWFRLRHVFQHCRAIFGAK